MCFEHPSAAVMTAPETEAGAAGQTVPGCAGIREGCINSRRGSRDGQSDLGREPPQHFTQHLFPLSDETQPSPSPAICIPYVRQGGERPWPCDEENHTHPKDK